MLDEKQKQSTKTDLRVLYDHGEGRSHGHITAMPTTTATPISRTTITAVASVSATSKVAANARERPCLGRVTAGEPAARSSEEQVHQLAVSINTKKEKGIQVEQES